MADSDPKGNSPELDDPNETLPDLAINQGEDFEIAEEDHLQVTSPLSECFDDLSSDEAQKIIDESKSTIPELENPTLKPTLIKLRKSRAVNYSYITKLSKNVVKVINEGIDITNLVLTRSKETQRQLEDNMATIMEIGPVNKAEKAKYLEYQRTLARCIEELELTVYAHEANQNKEDLKTRLDQMLRRGIRRT